MSKRENVWNQLLFEKSRQGGFVNKNLLILGRKGSGKRSVIDALAEVSKTKQCTLRTKFTTPIIDYTYLNLIDLRDPDYTTNARLNVYILEEESQKYLLPRILNHKNIRNTFVVISLDLQEPWTFMEDLDRWVSVLQDLLAELKLNLQELEDMKSNGIIEWQLVSKYVGDLRINLGLPIMVLVNKSDILERDDKGKDWDSKAEVIQYCLREFCVNYGATLLFTSVKQKINIQLMYEYVLHRLYEMPMDMTLKNLSDVESLFIPLGQDDLNIIKSTFTKLANQVLKYEELVPVVLSKKNQPKEELIAEEDQDFFAKLKEKSQQVPASKPILPISVPQKTEEQPALSARGGVQSIQLKEFYDKFLTGKNEPLEKGAVQNATQQLHERLNKTKAETTIVKNNTLFNAQDQQKLQKIIPNVGEKNFEALLKIKK